MEKDTDLVRNVQRVVVGRQADVRLLFAVRAERCSSLENPDRCAKLTNAHRMRVLTLAAWTSYSFFTASLIWRLFARMSVMKTRVLCSSIFFIADSVFSGLASEHVSAPPSQATQHVVYQQERYSRNNRPELVHTGRMGNGFAGVLGVAGEAEGLGAVEGDGGAHFARGVCVRAVERGLFGGLGLRILGGRYP